MNALFRRLVCITLTFAIAPALAAQTLTLSPAVVPLAGSPGESATWELTLHNGADRDIAFGLEARDVVVRDGARAFVAAGELSDSIAATAVFTPARVTVPAGGSRSVAVTFTRPPAVRHRGVVAFFRSLEPVTAASGQAAFASLGTLFTFTLSEHLALAADLVAEPPTASRNAVLSGALANAGSEPLVARGVAVILDAAGAVVGKASFEQRRLLPGERTTARAEYAGELPSGSYQAVATFEVGGRAVTRSAALVVP